MQNHDAGAVAEAATYNSSQVTSDVNVFVFKFLNIAIVSDCIEMICFVIFGPLPLPMIYSFASVYLLCIYFLGIGAEISKPKA